MKFWDQSVVGPIPQISSVVIPKQHFLSAGIESQNQKLLPLGSDASSNPFSSPCGELIGLLPMLLPNLTQNKEVLLPSNPRGKNLRFWD